MGSLITVVFVDIEGSTELLTRLGDRAGLDAIDAFSSEVRGNGSRPTKVARSSRSVTVDARVPSAAAGDQFAVAVSARSWTAPPLLRVGINTGEVTGAVDDPVGEAVSAAARIGDRAVGGEVLVSEVVRQLVGTMPGVRFADRGRHRLRGFPERWRLYCVTGADGVSDPLPVFGRDRELDAVEWLLDGASGGVGRVLVLEGEAGIGKTHLVNAARLRSSQRGWPSSRENADDLERDQPGRLLFMIGTDLGIDLDALARDLPEGGAAAIEALVEAIGGHAARATTRCCCRGLALGR